MRKYFAFVLLISLLLMYGCGEAQAPSSAEPPASGTENTVISEEQTGGEPAVITQNGDGQNAPVGGMMFTEGAMVLGRVKSVIGNSVELELAEIDEDQMVRFAERNPDMTPDPNRTFDPNRTPDPNRQGMIQRGEMPEGFAPPEDGQMFVFDGEGQGGKRMQGGGQVRNIELNYTGETADYLIPVGLSVGGGDYTSIKSGMVLRLMLDDNDEVVSVMIISS